MAKQELEKKEELKEIQTVEKIGGNQDSRIMILKVVGYKEGDIVKYPIPDNKSFEFTSTVDVVQHVRY
jgi:hypothetical protein